MAGLGVGVMHNTINSRFGPKPLIHADYLTGLACGADSFWVADHLNSVLPPSMWTPEACGRGPGDPEDRRSPRAVDDAGLPGGPQSARPDAPRGWP